ncbi:MAG: adenylate/guanylate cyclase domain-containing protein [Bacillota bacterium]|nr:adenylate/guanylate cyclase domain-containing protein [Bacillota bacterium]
MKKYKLFRYCLFFAFIFLLVYLTMNDVLYPFDRIVMDAWYRNDEVANEEVKIIAIDEKTLNALGNFGSWNRSVYSDLIHQISDESHKPEIIAFDIIFGSSIESKGDQEFADACKDQNVLVGSSFKFNEVTTDIDSYDEPYEALKENTTQGFTNSILDTDNKVRSSLLKVNYNDKDYYNFSYTLASMYCKNHHLKLQEPECNDQNIFNFKYTAHSGDYETISFIDVLNGKVDKKIFANSVVLVGAYSTGMQDAYTVPIEKSKQMFGVEIQANIFEAILSQKTYMTVDKYYSTLYIVGFVFAVALVFEYLQLFNRLLVLISALLSHLMITRIFFFNGYEIGIITTVLALIVFYVMNILWEYILELVDKRRIVSTFKKYVAPDVVEQAINQGQVDIPLGGTLKDIAVLFVDIRGFTTLSEKLSPREVVDLLNDYFENITNAVFNNQGTLDKFIGDAAMAVFNSPFDLQDYTYKAVKTALDIQRCSEEIARISYEKTGIKIGFGVGVNCGEAIIGNMGSEYRVEFAAIGDTVNTASRLEGVAKAGQVIISKKVYERLKGRIDVTWLGNVSLKGKAKEVEIYQVNGLIDEKNEEDL